MACSRLVTAAYFGSRGFGRPTRGLLLPAYVWLHTATMRVITNHRLETDALSPLSFKLAELRLVHLQML